MRIAPEGRPFIALGWSLTALAWWAAGRGGWSVGWSVVAAVLSLLAIWLVVFFRDPARDGPRGDAVVIAPADGKIVGVVEADEPMYLKTRALRVSIFMSVFDCHVNRSPLAGKIERMTYHHGAFLNADLDKASEDNERNCLVIASEIGRIAVVQIAGLIARRIVCFVREGSTVGAGERIGMIRFGSRVDVYLPDDARLRVGQGQIAVAGETVLAELGTGGGTPAFRAG